MRVVDYSNPLELVYDTGEVRDCSLHLSSPDRIEVKDKYGYFWVIRRETATTFSGTVTLRNKQEKEPDLNDNKSFVGIVTDAHGADYTEHLTSTTLAEAKEELLREMEEYDNTKLTATLYSSVTSCSFKLDWSDE